jgi:hypothetical protein
MYNEENALRGIYMNSYEAKPIMGFVSGIYHSRINSAQ